MCLRPPNVDRRHLPVASAVYYADHITHKLAPSLVGGTRPVRGILDGALHIQRVLRDSMTFRDREKKRYAGLKSTLFSDAAQDIGTYKGKPREFCLADDCSEENLYNGIRHPGVRYFGDRRITWHDGLQDRRVPSNHLCCSQSCCINFLFPFSGNPRLLRDVFREFYPDLREPLPIDADLPLADGSSPYMAFEWIGTRDYLGEHLRKRGARTRGANYTSADFAFRFRKRDGRIRLVLGEWKYTEEYVSKDLGTPSSDRDKKPLVRKRNYCPAFDRDGGVFAGWGEDAYNALFFEPFYQLMRLQLLAQEMEFSRGQEMGAEVVTVLHVCPDANREFRDKVTSPYLAGMFPNKGTLEIWQELVRDDRFMSISVEKLLDTIVEQAGTHDQGWVDYLKTRYGWDRLPTD